MTETTGGSGYAESQAQEFFDNHRDTMLRHLGTLGLREGLDRIEEVAQEMEELRCAWQADLERQELEEAQTDGREED